jgi:acyl dehydratase
LTSFNDIRIGQVATIRRNISPQDVAAFAACSGDYNPLHIDSEFAGRTRFKRPIAHGILVAGYVSAAIGTQLPGPGACWIQQSFRWPAPVFIGDQLEISLTITHKSNATHTLGIKVRAVNQHGTVVMEGEGMTMLLEPT